MCRSHFLRNVPVKHLKFRHFNPHLRRGGEKNTLFVGVILIRSAQRETAVDDVEASRFPPAGSHVSSSSAPAAFVHRAQLTPPLASDSLQPVLLSSSRSVIISYATSLRGSRRPGRGAAAAVWVRSRPSSLIPGVFKAERLSQGRRGRKFWAAMECKQTRPGTEAQPKSREPTAARERAEGSPEPLTPFNM